MPVATLQGIDTWYEFRGEGPLLVLTHGFAGPTTAWPPVVDELAQEVRLLFYDVRGHGRTSLPDAATFSMPRGLPVLSWFSPQLSDCRDAD